jgi:hypothetical protein
MKNIVGYAYKLRGWVGSTDSGANFYGTNCPFLFY